MTSTRLTRRALLRGVVVTTAGAGLAAALPGTARADGCRTRPPAAVDPLGADTPGDLGASLRDGTPAGRATGRAHAPRNAGRGRAGTAALPYKNFLRYDFELRTLPPELQAYALTAPMPAGYGVVDSTGVRMVDRAGTALEPPCGAGPVRHGTAGELPAHPGRAVPHSRVDAGRPPDQTCPCVRRWAVPPLRLPVLPAHTAVRVPPWYSAIAQGQVLDFFTRLHAVTGNAGHKAEADGTFQS